MEEARCFIPAYIKGVTPIFASGNSYLAFYYGAHLFVHRNEQGNHGFVASFKLDLKCCKQILINDSPMATNFLIAVITESEIVFVNVSTAETFLYKVVSSLFLWDPMSESSFFVFTNRDKLQRVTLNKKLNVEWEIEAPVKLKDAKISLYDSHYMVIITEDDDAHLLYRENVSSKFQTTRVFDAFSDKDPPVSAMSFNNEFFGLAAAHGVYLLSIRAKHIIGIIGSHTCITNAWSLNESNPTIVLMKNDNSLDLYKFKDGEYKFETMHSIQFDDAVVPLSSTSSEFVIRCDDGVRRIEIINDRMVTVDFFEVLTLKTPYVGDIYDGRMAFVEEKGSVCSINLDTFEITMRMCFENVTSVKFYSKDVLLVLANKKLEICGLENVLPYDNVLSFRVCHGSFLTIAVSPTKLVNCALDGSFTKEREFEEVNDYDVLLVDKEFRLAVSAARNGIVFCDENMQNVGEPLAISYRNEYYTRVCASTPYVLTFSNFRKIVRVDLRNFEIMGPFSDDEMTTVVPLSTGKFCFTTSDDLRVLNDQMITTLKIRVNNVQMIGQYMKALLFLQNGVIMEMTGGKRTEAWKPYTFPTFSVEALQETLTLAINIMLHSHSVHNDIDDMCSILDIEEPPRKVSNFRQIYHLSFLTFAGATIPEANRKSLCEYAKEFARVGKHLTAASIMHIMGDKIGCVRYLCDSNKYFDLALVYCSKTDSPAMHSEITGRWINQLLVSGDLVHFVPIHAAEISNDSERSLAVGKSFKA